MNSISLKYKPYTLELKTPFKSSKSNITERKGFIIKLISSSGKTGYGDACPFPEFGSETFQSDEEELKNLKFELNVDLLDLPNTLKKNLERFDDFPALRHGFEQAVLNLICNQTDISLNHFLNYESAKEIFVNAVIGIQSKDKTIEQSQKYLSEGFTTLKVKIGRTKFEDDFEIISALRNKLGSEFQLRLDVNGNWSFNEAKKYLDKMSNLEIEYIEQPVKNLNDFIKLKKYTSIPLAADESIKSLSDAKDFIEQNASSYLILKPMLLGGLLNTLEIIELAIKNNVGVVITSSFESAIGRSFAIFAASTIKNNTAHGLNVSHLFKNDIVKDPYPVKNGKISLEI